MKKGISIGKKIKQLRESRGLTLDELSKKSKCGKSYIWELECHDYGNPSVTWLMNISRVFGVTVEYFLAGESKRSAEDQAFFKAYLELPDKTKRQIREISLILKGGE